MKNLDIKKIFKNKKVIVTGHTGFKGSWLSYWLLKNGARVVGISNNIPTTPSHYQSLKLKDNIEEYFFNIENFKRLDNLIRKIKPDFILTSPIMEFIVGVLPMPLRPIRVTTSP